MGLKSKLLLPPALIAVGTAVVGFKTGRAIGRLARGRSEADHGILKSAGRYGSIKSHNFVESCHNRLNAAITSVARFRLNDGLAWKMLLEYLDNAPIEHVLYLFSGLRRYQKDSEGTYRRVELKQDSFLTNNIPCIQLENLKNSASEPKRHDRVLRTLRNMLCDPNVIILAVSYVYSECPDIFQMLSAALDSLQIDDDKEVYLWVDKHDAINRPKEWIVCGLDPYLAFPVLAVGDDKSWRSRTWTVMERTLAQHRCGIVNTSQGRGDGLSLPQTFDAVAKLVLRGDLIYTHTYWIDDKISIMKWAATGLSFKAAYGDCEGGIAVSRLQIPFGELNSNVAMTLMQDREFRLCLQANKVEREGEAHNLSQAFEEYLVIKGMGYDIVKTRRETPVDGSSAECEYRPYLIRAIKVAMLMIGVPGLRLLGVVLCVFLTCIEQVLRGTTEKDACTCLLRWEGLAQMLSISLSGDLISLVTSLPLTILGRTVLLALFVFIGFEGVSHTSLSGDMVEFKQHRISSKALKILCVCGVVLVYVMKLPGNLWRALALRQIVVPWMVFGAERCAYILLAVYKENLTLRQATQFLKIDTPMSHLLPDNGTSDSDIAAEGIDGDAQSEWTLTYRDNGTVHVRMGGLLPVGTFRIGDASAIITCGPRKELEKCSSMVKYDLILRKRRTVRVMKIEPKEDDVKAEENFRNDWDVFYGLHQFFT